MMGSLIDRRSQYPPMMKNSVAASQKSRTFSSFVSLPYSRVNVTSNTLPDEPLSALNAPTFIFCHGEPPKDGAAESPPVGALGEARTFTPPGFIR